MSETQAGAPRQFTDLFPESDIPRILGALCRGCDGLRKKSDADREDWISRRLCRRLKRIEPFRNGPFTVDSQVEVLDAETDANTPEGKLDIKVSCPLGAEVYFAIEAKRLRVRGRDGKVDALAADYVKEGMMRFVVGQYAPMMQSGAMLGYVFDGNVTLARQNVSHAIGASAPTLQLISGKGLLASRILASAPIDETLHALTGRTFTIYHLLVPV